MDFGIGVTSTYGRERLLRCGNLQQVKSDPDTPAAYHGRHNFITSSRLPVFVDAITIPPDPRPSASCKINKLVGIRVLAATDM
jgi:hypothetical protein